MKRFGVFVFLILFILLSSSAVSAVTINGYGDVIIFEGVVLSEEDEDEEEETEVEDESEEESDSEDEKLLEKQLKFQEKERIKSEKGTLKLEKKEGKLYIRTIKEGDSYAGDEYEIEEYEFGEGEEIEIEESTASASVKVKVKNQHYYIAKARIAARTRFPLSIDLNTNELIVTTPSGVKRVTVLPDVAVANMLSRDIVDVIEGLEENDPEYTEEFEMEENEEGTLVYKIPGLKKKKFIGLFEVDVPKEVEISVETGEVVDINQTLGEALLDAFSF